MVCGPFPLDSTANTEFLLMKTQRVLNRSNKCANCVIVKTSCFYNLALIHNQNLKKFSTLFLRHLPRITRYGIEQGFMVGSLNWRS